MYNDYNWGGYLMWRFPDRKVSIDGRTYVARDRIYPALAADVGRRARLENDPELLPRASCSAPSRCRSRPRSSAIRAFRLAYEDGTSAVFVRNR
jgi:hypothetical protein